MHDVIVVGGGIAGLTAAFYSARRGLSVLMITKDIGGQARETDLIENYPGILDIGGGELSSVIRKQALDQGVEELFAEVERIKSLENGFVVTASNLQHKARAVILCLGKSPGNLEAFGESKFRNKGISYCAVCDGPLCKGKIVAVVGEGEMVLDTSLQIARFAKHAYCLDLGKTSGHPMLIKSVRAKKNITYVPALKIISVIGHKHLEGAEFIDQKGAKQILKIERMFVELGYSCNTSFLRDLGILSGNGQIIVDEIQQSKIPGLFAAGDATNRPYKQAVISAGEGALAALSCFDYLMGRRDKESTASDWTKIKVLKRH
jgi:thioredoxin reductase (NADPH)